MFEDHRPLKGQDPHLTNWGGHLLLCESIDDRQIAISTLDSLQSPQRIDTQIVWSREDEFEVWAPELHQIDGLWYIYYSFSDGNNRSHRTHVIGAGHSPFGPYHFRERVGPDVWGIDMTTFVYNGWRYAAWSGWERNNDDFPQELYIAQMNSPVDVGNRIKISHPRYPWERSVEAINEAPQAYIHPEGQLSLFFSANASWTVNYATGLLMLDGDPLDPNDWSKLPYPLATNVGHGHAFEDQFIYHRKMSFLPGWQDREVTTMPLEVLWP